MPKKNCQRLFVTRTRTLGILSNPLSYTVDWQFFSPFLYFDQWYFTSFRWSRNEKNYRDQGRLPFLVPLSRLLTLFALWWLGVICAIFFLFSKYFKIKYNSICSWVSVFFPDCEVESHCILTEALYWDKEVIKIVKMSTCPNEKWLAKMAKNLFLAYDAL